MTKLKCLSEIVCGNGKIPVFKSQVVMFQALTICTTDRPYPCCGFESMEELRGGIRDYLKMQYMGKKSYDHIKVHVSVIQLLTNNYMVQKVNAIQGQERYLSNGIDHCLKSNVSRVINGNRPLPLYWRKAYLKYRNDTSIMCERLAWILQYLEVYYHGTGRFAVKRKEPVKYGGYTSYYEIETNTAKKLYSVLAHLYEDCNTGYGLRKIVDFYDLAEVLLNVLISGYENSISSHAKGSFVHKTVGHKKRYGASMDQCFIGDYTVTFDYVFFDNQYYVVDNCIYQDRA